LTDFLIYTMADPPPTSVSTSTDRLSSRPVKKRALTPASAQAASLDALFARPDKPVEIPTSGASNARELAPPPEIVTNVQGSSSGAGSGEFHVYKASRRREYERIRLMDEEVERETKEREWKAKQEELGKRDETKTSRNKAKREKAKLRKEMAKKGVGQSQDGSVKKGLPKAPRRKDDGNDNDKDSFTGEVKAVDEDSAAGIVIHDDDDF
jgi:hypothetical protein